MKRNRKKKAQDAATADGSLIQTITISLFIILLAFFILLNSIAVLNEKKVVAAIGSLLGSFGQKSGGYSIIDGTGEKNLTVPMTTYTGRVDFSDIITDNPTLAQKIQVISDPRGSLVRIPVADLFDPSSTRLNPSGNRLISAVVKTMQKNTYPVEISCHTDNTPIMIHNAVSNLEISAMRALHILQFCVETGKVAAERMTAYGRGASSPAYSNRMLQTRELNNRTDILFVHKLSRKKPKGGFIFKDFFFRPFSLD